MGIQDRGYYGDEGGGGFRGGVRRMFSSGDFFSWSLPLFRVFGIRVKIHLVFVIFIVAQLVASLRYDAFGFNLILLGMVVLFVLVLLHEFGHCFACRWVGGEADEILMWPLGGLAFCAPPHHWKASLITTIGGPAVNVLILPISAAAVLALGGGWGAVLFNPLAPAQGLINSNFTEFWKIAVWWVYYINLLLLAFNVLLPMFPMDGGRIMQEVMWARMGYRKSLQIAAGIGLILAIAVGVFAAVGQQTQLLMIALFAGFTCWSERRKAEFLEDESPWSMEVARGTSGRSGRAEERKYREAQKRQEQEQKQQAELDRILAKIAATGMDSLTRSEKRTLRNATETKRKQTGTGR